MRARCSRWGAPLWDAHAQLGLCGDWCLGHRVGRTPFGPGDGHWRWPDPCCTGVGLRHHQRPRMQAPGRGAGQLAGCPMPARVSGWCAWKTSTPAHRTRRGRHIIAPGHIFCGLHSDEPVAVQSTRTEPTARRWRIWCSNNEPTLLLFTQGHCAGLQQQGVHRESAMARWVCPPAPVDRGLPAAVRAKPGAPGMATAYRPVHAGHDISPRKTDTVQLLNYLTQHAALARPASGHAATGRGHAGRRLRAAARDGCFTYQWRWWWTMQRRASPTSCQGEDLADNMARQGSSRNGL